jgi:tetratricopeptide (TPR) repeat protein
VGRVDAAQADLASARALAPGDGDTDAIASSIALGRNDSERALTLARAATATAPARPLPWLALSYAEQASFDLPAARAAMDRALAADPGNGVLRARLAELLLALGDFDAAQAAADRAVQDAPRAALAQRAQGFAALLRIDLESARAAFLRALALDPADPPAHLGLGLTEIRSGRLAAGREQIETAVSLDPLQSLLRTYLGRAYFDERRDALAATAYDIAAELDPKDPTPWLYRAVQLRAQNRPVEALDALETSLRLNDYRAQFRTPATLAADEAARTAAVGQIYRDLGFDQLALVQGFRAVTEAPGDQAGHRLLADVYAVLPRHEEARVSELLQAQLLQPLTRTPVLPLQGETRLLATETLGPSVLGLGEYGPLFERNGLSGWVTVLGGNRETFGGQILASGLIDRVGFSIGQYRFDTAGSGGVREQSQDIQVGFVQAQLSPQTSVQAEFRHTDTEEGPYLEGGVYTAQDHTQTNSARLGLTQRWSPGSVTMASVIGRRWDETQQSAGQADVTDPLSREAFSGRVATDGWSAELRQDWRRDALSVALGASRFDGDSQLDLDHTEDWSEDIYLNRFRRISDYDFDLRLSSVWLYGTLHPSANLDLTLGLSWASLQWNANRVDTASLALLDPDYGWVPLPVDPAGLDTSPQTVASRSEAPREGLNPKLGFTWRPRTGTTLRAAAFRTLRGPDAMKQTIEPTAVAGFNQLFDGDIGERVWRYGIGIDQRISEAFSIGAEGSRRDVSVPQVQVGDEIVWRDRRERFARAYAALTPTARLALSAQYFFEQNVIRQDTAAEDRTHRAPLSLSYFDPSGLFGSLRGTYVQQSANPVASTTAVRSSFWSFGLSLGRRLPKRAGIIALAIDNLLDTDIDYRETDPNRPLFVGERVFSLRTTLQF